MLFKSQLVTQASGSAGGLTASRNRYGQYLRARVLPVNPNSVAQQAVRNSMTSLVQRWTESLTDAQRSKWSDYAAAVPVTNRVGDQVYLTAQNMYVRSNVQRYRYLPASLVDDAPVVFDLGTFTPVVIQVDSATGDVAVTFTATDAWNNEDGGFLFVFVGRPINGTRNFFGGPYRQVGAVDGDSVAPPASPMTIGSYPFGLPTAGQRIFARVTAGRADGRYSSAQVVAATIV